MSSNIKTSEGSDERPKTIVNIISSAEITANRVNTLLRIVDSLTPKVSSFDPETFSSEETPMELDGGVQVAMENTLIKTLERIDRIVGQDDIWSTRGIDNLAMEQLEEINAINIQAAEYRLKTARLGDTPFFRFHAKAARTTTGFIAFLGELDVAGTLIGYGKTLDEAIENFNLIANGENPSST